MGKQRCTGHNSFVRASINDPFDCSCVAIVIPAYRGQKREVPPKIPSLASRGMESSSPLTEGTRNAHPQTDKIRKKGQNPPLISGQSKVSVPY
jgi:hypothetical protein